ncbi:hypothetical protein AAW01_12095 [Aurantiacibacter gangjinensis]|uniref:Thioredoxin-like fold domain-containing protein n=1 Tax=Aurantiacibacter gangjinensis TaxID=502682 RepID=A0A0G9MNN2_9SPHN|nr:hypothetical protein AAW01_12095 [Aurantiacibacter gangjinensis]
MGLAALFLLPTAPAMAQNWNAEFADTGQGIRVGDAEAPLQIVSYSSYTCPHCAQFERQSEAELRYFFVHEGFAALEVRHMIRNPVDLAAALLTECGDTDRFFDNHKAIMASQQDWLTTAQGLTHAQIQRWNAGTVPARMRAIASDLGFYDIMEGRGYSRTEMDRCLSDQPKAEAISALSSANLDEYPIQGTPSFVVNGELLEGVHSWEGLRAVLQAIRTGASAPQE